MSEKKNPTNCESCYYWIERNRREAFGGDGFGCCKLLWMDLGDRRVYLQTPRFHSCQTWSNGSTSWFPKPDPDSNNPPHEEARFVGGCLSHVSDGCECWINGKPVKVGHPIHKDDIITIIKRK